jgi:phage shock protein A
MKFLDRALRMVRADAHGIMDQLEERSLLLKQHLREAEIEITRKRVRLEALEEEERLLREETSRQEQELARLDADVELALTGEDQELARFAVRKLLPVRDGLRALAERSCAAREERERVAARMSEQCEQFEELRRQVAVQLAAAKRERGRCEADGVGACCQGEAGVAAGGVSDEEVELELLRRREAGAAVLEGGA